MTHNTHRVIRKLIKGTAPVILCIIIICFFSGLHALFFQDYFVILQHKGFVRPCAR